MAKKKTAKKKTTTKKAAATKKTTKKATTKKGADAEAAPDTSKQTYKKIRVNFWRTKLHDEELGIHQKLKYRAKTRRYAKNFDTEGVVEIDGEKKYIIAYNKDPWQEDPPEKKNLQLRLFTIMEEKMNIGKGGNFKGGIETSVAHSLVQSFEINHPAPVFFVQLPGNKNLIRIVRGWRLKGTRWTWPLLPEEAGDKLQMVKAIGTVGLGRDYDIFIGDVKVAKVDSQRITKDVEIDIYREKLAKDKEFVMILTLFGCVCRFMEECEDLIAHFFKGMKETGTTDFKPPRREIILFRNPRFVSRS
jgi:hypothetical protein